MHRIEKSTKCFGKLTPTRNLPKMRMGIDGAKPIMNAPTVKKKSAAIIVGFLPYLSANGPAIKDPRADPN